ncbi:AGE family epimerase/isomerase [Gaoshiqia sp. Z1-71]|uniref:AGE family epimerase/isomerase n=1 Tax=Gaoshiqia hydrogeniformans TaxID=3290090 RepID=UPI003BF87CCD
MLGQILNSLKDEMKPDLVDNILPYWMNRMPDRSNGGFYGQITGEEQIIEQANKGGILNARILWSFSATYNDLKNPEYLEMANRACNYIINHFFDEKHGGTYWSLRCDGQPHDTKKQIYSQSFFIYALAEYYRATRFSQSLEKAVELFHLIEKFSFDKTRNGYFEAFSREWQPLEDLRLSEKDANESKTMNTHLHILEAYTNLYRVWKDKTLETQLENLVRLFLDRIVDSGTFHLNLFFDDDWTCKSNIISYGHDIEASWLIYEAAEVLGKRELLEKTKWVCERIVKASMEGLQDDGSLIYEKDSKTGYLDANRHWWVQAEAVVGFLNMYELTHEKVYIEKASACWQYIKNNLVDPRNGEWFWSISRDGVVNRRDDKAGFWKCPYHNSRTCLEIIKRVERLIK